MDDGTFAVRAAGLEWLLFDVDGVLTDGRLVYGADGEQKKVFHVRDGLALRLARQAGLKVGILSGRQSPALERRVADLGLDALICGSKDKQADFARFLEEQGTSALRVAYVGDDLPDLPVLLRCGLAFCPADAVAEVQAVVHHRLATDGGHGAAREMIELLLKTRGDWHRLVAHYSRES
jgi:3-deoxy-D-manno-octulosonate 8-phosphate phosphatase (KDO 8-P phosphatase)